MSTTSEESKAKATQEFVVKSTATLVASEVARQAVATMEEIADDLRQEVAVLSESISTSATPVDTVNTNPIPRRFCAYVSAPNKPVSNFTQAIMASVKWRKGKGEKLAEVWMHKASTGTSLLIEQYGIACSLLLQDKSQPKCVFDASGNLSVPGKSIWTRFESVQGTLETVTRKLVQKGWSIVVPTPKVQLTLVDGIKA